MEYFKILNFAKEPFSNSPDPEAFFQSRQHVGCLQKLELAIRMRRGLNVVIGDVGTGKTTLCRQLIRLTGDDQKIESHLILDPDFSSESEFLQAVARMFLGHQPPAAASDWQLKEEIKQYLFRRAFDEQKIILLIIDEGQKIPGFCLETLREFLNYETNNFKLLQIVIFAQKEFSDRLQAKQNFADRINLCHHLNPLSFGETRAMIRYRLDIASGDTMGEALFSLPALLVVYRATKGYPRKIINLCHRIILTMIIQNRNKAGFFLALSCVKRVFPEQVSNWKLAGGVVIAALAALLVLVGISPNLIIPDASLQKTARKETASLQSTAVQKPLPAAAANQTPPPREAASPQLALQTNMAIASDVPAPQEEALLTPKALGTIKVSGEETLSRMIYLVYGPLSSFGEHHMEKFLEANPQISNPDLIQPGDLVTFPVMQIAMEPFYPGSWWVLLDRLETLADAYRAMRKYSGLENKIRLIPLLDDSGRLEFVIIERKGFASQEAAEKSLQGLPEHIIARAEVIATSDLGKPMYLMADRRDATE